MSAVDQVHVPERAGIERIVPDVGMCPRLGGTQLIRVSPRRPESCPRRIRENHQGADPGRPRLRSPFDLHVPPDRRRLRRESIDDRKAELPSLRHEISCHLNPAVVCLDHAGSTDLDGAVKDRHPAYMFVPRTAPLPDTGDLAVRRDRELLVAAPHRESLLCRRLR